ncbi:Blp family class II bacteriocin [Streptococcus mitis]|uniref:Blp family class II bacteriocin n=1 Tax=Streptococcus mitis TaxID=28037 RepID=UPI0021B66FEC|nr:Blp family class II bacteriocin [Streptococcus mitis]
MKTMRTIQFDVLDTEMLASIEGGTVSAGEVCTLAGAMIGSLVAPRAGTWGGGVL